VAGAIKRAVQRSGTKAKEAAVAVSANLAITKIISYPASLSKREIEDRIMMEAETLIPYPLEFYSLSELVLVGTLQQKSDGIWALVRVPDGIIHQVQVVDYIGKNHGKVLTITDVDLTLKEIIPDNNGGYLEREGSLSAMN
jgi:Tfp pilus assembly protein PilP